MAEQDSRLTSRKKTSAVARFRDFVISKDDHDALDAGSSCY